ncbi:MAG: hypothetical protein C0402_16700 [Thermodesulfovibrio sp.]|nr:hypothetical protein [Thermodesulfovibrio sp.]
MKNITFPEGKRFAFSIFDDTDYATVDNVKPVYALLEELRLRTTKSVWVFPAQDRECPYYQSQTLSDPEYLAFIRELGDRGFEIAFHSASMESSEREVTCAAFERFRELLGFYPNIHVNHAGNKENLYWGLDRLDCSPLRSLMRMKRKPSEFAGHDPGSPFFWGDLCRDRITYVRNFVFREINLLRVNPTMPYTDPRRPYVPYWFSSCEGGSVGSFNELLSLKNQKRLESEGGVCIVYTHFAKGFVENGRINRTTQELLEHLAGRNGWFVPVSQLLDYLRVRQPGDALTASERLRMELKWFWSKLMHGTS